MRKKVIVLVVIVAAFTVFVWLTFHLKSSVQQEKPRYSTFEDEPKAHALYDKMIEVMRAAESLSYKSECSFDAKGLSRRHCTYTIWMKKPNYFRVETLDDEGEEGGTIIGDGNNLWIYWPGERPHFSIEEEEDYEKTCTNVYMKEATPIGKHSIGHKDSLLGVGLMMIIDPSTFHGYTDSLQPYLEGVRSLGTETVSGELCDVIEVSFMKGQRNWYLWLSRRDNLPRKLKQVVRVRQDLIMHELWTEVTIDAEITMEKFVWLPPEGWQQWYMPKPEDILLKPGEEAPDFKLLSADGSKIKLSDYRDKVVWFYIWRAG